MRNLPGVVGILAVLLTHMTHRGAKEGTREGHTPSPPPTRNPLPHTLASHA